MSICQLHSSQPVQCESIRSPNRARQSGLIELALSVGAALNRWRAAYTFHTQRRARILELEALSDRQLLDIGVERAGIAKIVERTLRAQER